MILNDDSTKTKQCTIQLGAVDSNEFNSFAIHKSISTVALHLGNGIYITNQSYINLSDVNIQTSSPMAPALQIQNYHIMLVNLFIRIASATTGFSAQVVNTTYKGFSYILIRNQYGGSTTLVGNTSTDTLEVGLLLKSIN